MGKETIHSLAQADTPAFIDVPNTWSGLLIWAVGRFGSGILLAAVCVIGMARVYEDHKELNKELIVLVHEQAQASAGLQSTLTELKSAITIVASEAHKAHNTQP